MGNVCIRMIKRNVLKYTMCCMELYGAACRSLLLSNCRCPSIANCFIPFQLTTSLPASLCSGSSFATRCFTTHIHKHMSSVISTGGFSSVVRVFQPEEAERRRQEECCRAALCTCLRWHPKAAGARNSEVEQCAPFIEQRKPTAGLFGRSGGLRKK